MVVPRFGTLSTALMSGRLYYSQVQKKKHAKIAIYEVLLLWGQPLLSGTVYTAITYVWRES